MRRRCHAGNEHAVEQIAGKGDAGIFHQIEQRKKIVRGGAGHKKPGRVDKDLVHRLDGLHHRIEKGQKHQRPGDQQKQKHPYIAAP